MSDFRAMSTLAKMYWGTVVLSGIVCVAAILTADGSGIAKGWARLCVYVVIATIVSGLKIRLPGIFGTLSMNYVVTMIALLTLNTGAAIIVAAISTAGQCLYHAATRPKWFQVVFSTCSVPLPVLAASWLLHTPFLSRFELGSFMALVSAVNGLFSD